jgi:excisionase family DNA binding protein
MMTRNDARIIAEELYRLIKKDSQLLSNIVREVNEEYMNSHQASEFLNVSLQFLKKNIKDIPHTKVGRLNRFKKSSLIEYMNK